MSAIIANDTDGLNTHGNDLAAKVGSTSVADNVVFTREGRPERRTGFKDYSSNLPDFNPSQLISSANGTQAYLHLDNGIWYDSSGTWLRKRGEMGVSLTEPWGLAYTSGYLYVSTVKHTILKYNMTTGVKTLLAGRHGVNAGTDGTGDAARFDNPRDMVIVGANMYVCDSSNHTIRKIVLSTGVVTTLAGTAGASGSTDATGSSARFNGPTGICSDGTNLYVTDSGNHTIRKIVISSGVVTTLAGTAGASGSTNATGAAARFTDPRGIVTDNANLYVCDTTNDTIRKIVISSGVVTTLAGTAGASGTTDGVGAAARFSNPNGLYHDGSNLFVCDTGNHTIRKIVVSSATVSTVAGSTGGNTDGVGTAAQFYNPRGIVGDGTHLYVCEYFNNTVRKVYIPDYYVCTVEGSPSLIDAPTHGIKFASGIVYNSRRVRSFEMSGNTYFTSDKGIIKSTSASADLQPAGIPRALDMLASEGAGTIFTAANKTRAYRHTWALKDANNNLVVGPPSGRVLFTSSAGSKNCSLTLRIPPDITSSHVYQVFATAIASSSADPGDEMVLIYENNPTGVQIAAGTISYEDKIPDEFRNFGTPLYTNTTQEGSAASNNQPPLARDVCEFRNHAFYANYTDPHRMTLQLVDAASLVAGTSTLTICGGVYTANAAEAITTGTFIKYTAGSATVNVEETARSLCRVINGYAANTTIYATYISTPDTAPGKILIEERGVGGSAFVATANDSTCGNCFVPPIPTTGTTYTSIAERRRNRIRVSKQFQPEHVPIYRDVIVGSENDEIQRIIPLQDMVIVIKDRSIWRVTGTVLEDFQATIHDDTVSIAGRDSAAKLNNTVFSLSNQGFVAIGANGVQIIGRPEEHRVIAGLDAKNAPDHDTFVGVGVEVERLYLCRAYDAAAAKNVTYAYNAITRQWSRWLIDPDCFAVVNDRIMYGLNNSLGHVLLERASRRDGEPQYRDMSEEDSLFIASSLDATTVTGTVIAGVDYTGSAYSSSIGHGWVLQGDGAWCVVLSASDLGGGVIQLTVNSTSGLDAETMTAHRPIPVTIEWNPLTGGNPGELKQFGEITIRCETQNAYKASLYYANEYDRKTDPASTTWVAQPAAIEAYISPDQTKPSATNTDFGATAGNVNPNNVIRSFVAKDRTVGCQLQPKLYHSVADARLSIKALVVDARPMGTTKGHQ